MADEHLLTLLRHDIEQWNQWRQEHPTVRPILDRADFRGVNLTGADLSGADFSWSELSGQDLRGASLARAEFLRADLTDANLAGADMRNTSLRWAFLAKVNLSAADLRGAALRGADLSGAILSSADLSHALLIETNLSGAQLQGANCESAFLSGTNLSWANLHGANLRRANLSGWGAATAIPPDDIIPPSILDDRASSPDGRLVRGADLTRANLTEVDLTDADLSGVNLLETQLTRANLTGSVVYGISAWNVELSGTVQVGLRITPAEESSVTVDSLEVAQFLYLLLHNAKIRTVIDTITTKVVLILGRFTPERKAVLDALREALHQRNYVPVLFDFEAPSTRNFTETVTLLARLARFIIADLTDPASIPQELQAIVPHVHVPVQPIIAQGHQPYAMFADYQDFPWVLKIYRYADLESLIATTEEEIIAPAEAKIRGRDAVRQLGSEDAG